MTHALLVDFQIHPDRAATFAAAITAHPASAQFREFDALTRDGVMRKAVRTHVLQFS